MVDCVFVEQKYIRPHMKSVLNFQEQLSIIAPHESTAESLTNLPIIVNNMESCPYRKLLLNWVFSKIHSTPAIVEFDTVEAICNAVSLNMGISLLPTNVVVDKMQISVFPIKEIGTLNIHMVTLGNQQIREVYQLQKYRQFIYIIDCLSDYLQNNQKRNARRSRPIDRRARRFYMYDLLIRMTEGY